MLVLMVKRMRRSQGGGLTNCEPNHLINVKKLFLHFEGGPEDWLCQGEAS